ncbi:hypothetical protein [Massilia sp. Dwa41.01b]|uniref:hypothetical protein n=1 Tax=Massilia sp. Dwa41.01b TaxID=2709302 RepID=UPI002805D6AD|nr:hypothetical protein [Massilia sp. Dwa41.01b]
MRDLATIRRPVMTLACTAAAMLACAANSLLCRLALQDGSIDPASFGALRVVAGALALGAFVRLRREKAAARPDWWSASMLFAWVACFSFAYVSLPAGMGALVLFGAVQLTMFGAALRKGERFSLPGWLGLAWPPPAWSILCCRASPRRHGRAPC